MFFKEHFFLEDKKSGNAYSLGRTNTIGRTNSNDIIIKNALVSRVHCKITRINNELYLEDLKSKNGVSINNCSVTGRVKCKPGDEIQIPQKGFTLLLKRRLYPAPPLLFILIVPVILGISYNLKGMVPNLREFKISFPKKTDPKPASLETDRTQKNDFREKEHSVQQDIKKLIRSKLVEYGESPDYIDEKTVALILGYMRQFYIDNSYLACERERQKYIDLITVCFKESNIPIEFSFIPWIESNFNPQAYNSISGARGMWQIMPGTARGMGLIVSGKYDERIDPRKSTEAAAKYLTELLALFSDEAILLIVASYNSGNNIIRYSLRQIKDPGKQRNFLYIKSLGHLPKETEEYVFKFVAFTMLHELYGKQELSLL